MKIIIHLPALLIICVELREGEGLLHAEREQEKGVLKGGISDTIIASRSSPMPRIHIHLP